jgi:hypothetical protein
MTLFCGAAHERVRKVGHALGDLAVIERLRCGWLCFTLLLSPKHPVSVPGEIADASGEREDPLRCSHIGYLFD